ncbi:uncharacterized protein SAPINGB_P002246 [Magnusiomyces paraingens]|uniref:2,4-dienoyl-CoA reductase [(3E)-enoyl-CoA-producing] n=1 Tax=Magnusiomyces paraingens TaxID=2606893 RepID=A0A5E8BKU9_9ASCO|nr:uncharacterized protein SAPINGB_P002246 [Saprochaete ingens]VVT49388.1 unnamed protein product [Saprochaete ingens]
MTSLDKSFLDTSVWKKDIFKGKVAFITGGAGTIGRVQSQALVLLGADIAIIGRRVEVTEKAAQEIAQLRPGAKVLGIGGVDVRDVSLLKKAVERTLRELGRIDFVIAGAAGNFLAPFAGLSTNAFKTVVDIDLVGSYNTAKATFEAVRKTKGVYLFISAGLHYAGTPMQSHACAAKAGVDALSNNMAIELGPLGIRSNTICPGAIEGTEGMDRLVPKEELKEMVSKIPLGAMGKPQDIAEGTVFLLSDAAKYISGTTLVVDASQWRMGNFAAINSYPQVLSNLNGGKNKI